MATKTKKGAKPAEAEVDEDLDLEDLDEDVTEDEAKATKTKKSSGQEITFGVKHLAEHLSKKLDRTVTTRELRAQIRRMARDDSGRVDREIVAGNRSRYDWPKGLKDPEVKAIIAAVMGGEMDEAKKKALEDLKNRPKKNKKGKKGKSKAKVEETEVDDELEDDDE